LGNQLGLTCQTRFLAKGLAAVAAPLASAAAGCVRRQLLLLAIAFQPSPRLAAAFICCAELLSCCLLHCCHNRNLLIKCRALYYRTKLILHNHSERRQPAILFKQDNLLHLLLL
jgi:hypothetical protein